MPININVALFLMSKNVGLSILIATECQLYGKMNLCNSRMETDRNRKAQLNPVVRVIMNRNYRNPWEKRVRGSR